MLAFLLSFIVFIVPKESYSYFQNKFSNRELCFTTPALLSNSIMKLTRSGIFSVCFHCPNKFCFSFRNHVCLTLVILWEPSSHYKIQSLNPSIHVYYLIKFGNSTCVFSRLNILLSIFQEWLECLMWNEKEMNNLDTERTIWSWTLTSIKILPFFHGRILQYLHLWNCWSGWCQMERKQMN